MHDSNYCLIKYLAADVSDDGESLGKLGEPSTFLYMTAQ